MSDTDDVTIVASDLYEVPRAIDPTGSQVRPTDGTSRDGYTCPICQGGVTRLTSTAGNPFFRHQRGGPTCRAEPVVHWAAREILRGLIERARTKLVTLNVRAPCDSCGAGNEIGFPLGDTTLVADHVLLEPEIATIKGADLLLMDNGKPVAGIVILTDSTRPARMRSDLPIQWIEVSAQGVKGSDLLRKALYGQRQEVTLSAVSSLTIVTCSVCKAKQERTQREEDERQQQVARDQARLDQQARDLATRLSRMSSWAIVMPTKCTICQHELAVSVNRSVFNRAEPLVRDDEGHPWHVALMRGGKVWLGILIVQAATFDGVVDLGGTVPYAIVPLLDEPFAARDGVFTLITKHVRFVKEPKTVCIHCAQVERLAEEAKQRAEAKRIANQEAKRRAEALRVAEEAQQREEDERIRQVEQKEQAARRKAEERQQQQEAEASRQREKRAQAIRDQLAVIEAARLAREEHKRSPIGQLQRLIETAPEQILNRDQVTFLRIYRDLRRAISVHRNADPSTADLAAEAQARLDRIARIEWVAVQKREHQRLAKIEMEKRRNDLDASWQYLLGQLQFWRSEKEWTMSEELAIDAFAKLIGSSQLVLPPAKWDVLQAGRLRRGRPPEIRAEVLPPR